MSVINSSPYIIGEQEYQTCNQIVNTNCSTNLHNFETAVDAADPLNLKNKDGTVIPIIYNRSINATKGSRTRGSGCPIRGDLFVAPQTQNWFKSSLGPKTDLHQGAMSVLAGNLGGCSNQR